jgi:glycerol-3-phosphate dehydrogenase
MAMWNQGWRDEIWDNLQQEWDLIIIGGGITGAGVLRQAVHAGLKVLLVEANDFTFGTSSRSSKLVHGGFRYLREKQVEVTKESVRERERLLKAAPHLVTKLGFLLADYENFHVPMAEFGLGVIIYDLLAPKWDHKRLSPKGMLRSVPGLRAEKLLGGFLYYDAEMDDSRVVLRLLRESVHDGGTALSYAHVEKLLRTKDRQVCGVVLRDTASIKERTAEVKAKVVVNATGPWSDELRSQVGGDARMRKLRGSHLIFSQDRWPLHNAATLIHPRDHRALFTIPWEGTSMIGTTDLDHDPALEKKYREPFCSQEEIDYLLEALNFLFPDMKATQKDILSTFSGVRPTIRSGDTSKPSSVSRAHALWQENGLITITGGKFTTFRLMANETIEAVLGQLGRTAKAPRQRMFNPLHETKPTGMAAESFLYLVGRHGFETAGMLECAQHSELETIAPLSNVWAEIRWAAREEGVEHLDDLLLRRVRLGMLLPNGAQDLLPRIRPIAQPELGWSDTRWQKEEKEYISIWKKYYSQNPG